MPLVSQNLFTISRAPSYTSFYVTNTHLKPLKFPNRLALKPFTDPFHFHLKTHHFLNPTNLTHTHERIFPVNAAFELDNAVKDHGHNVSVINFDTFLSILEFLCLASSVIVLVGYVVNYGFSRVGKPVFGWLGSRVMVWQWVVLVSGMVVGAVIRRRQWRRICNVDFSRSGGSGGVNLVERIEKLEEDLRSSATIIRVLSRQLEKLGIRFRVTRKALKEPIAKTAELAQKNSEATRALAAQEDLLEKELGEIQKVLLAMQEQQQKQLELILAIAKNGKLWDNKRESNQHQSSTNPPNSAVDGVPQLELDQIEALARQKQAKNEKA